ncbi:Retrovirus-related Pol polyprotein from transposon 17.6, partial [Mucuna pruriens]
MVKKASGKWWMRTNYTDLNKACPKDPYLLPSIDWLVDGVLGFALLSFMDSYLDNNQIQMHPQNEEKTAFITDTGAFCYKVMPFDLKNAGATYQRLMDKIIKDIISTNVEVYMDDMVMKSTVVGEHCIALERVFSILRRHQLKLNPEKCSFRIQAGKFLGFMLTVRGIEVNPENARAAETTMPIFGNLKKGGSFVWMHEIEEAFMRLKAILVAPQSPHLSHPRHYNCDKLSNAKTLECRMPTRSRQGLIQFGLDETNLTRSRLSADLDAKESD